jgi:hypothetical protein
MHSCRTREHVTQSVRCVECIHARSSSVVMAMLRCSSSVRRTTTWGIARQPASGTSIRASGPEDPAQPNGSHDGDRGAHGGDAVLHRARSNCNTCRVRAPHRCGGFRWVNAADGHRGEGVNADQREGSAEPLGGDATTVRARAASWSKACRTRPTTPPAVRRCGRRRRASRSDAERARSRGTAHRSERILTAPAG